MESLALLALAVAVGIDLPLVLLLPVLLSLVPGLGPLPTEWLPLASPAPALLGAFLFLVGWSIRRAPGLHWIWEGFHAVAAIPSAGFLVLMFHPTEPSLRLVALGLLFPVVAALLQGGRLGARLLDRVHPNRPHTPTALVREVVEDATVLLLLFLLLLSPPLAGAAAAMVLLAFAWLGGPALRAARFLPSLARGIFRHLTQPRSGWTEDRDLPRWLVPGSPRLVRHGGEEEETGSEAMPSGLRGTRAALAGPRDTGLFRAGWLLWDGDGTLFIYRTLTRTWEVELKQPETPVLPETLLPWGRVISVEIGQGFGVLLVPLDGPGNVEDRIRGYSA